MGCGIWGGGGALNGGAILGGTTVQEIIFY